MGKSGSWRGSIQRQCYVAAPDAGCRGWQCRELLSDEFLAFIVLWLVSLAVLAEAGMAPVRAAALCEQGRFPTRRTWERLNAVPERLPEQIALVGEPHSTPKLVATYRATDCLLNRVVSC